MTWNHSISIKVIWYGNHLPGLDTPACTVVVVDVYMYVMLSGLSNAVVAFSSQTKCFTEIVEYSLS